MIKNLHIIITVIITMDHVGIMTCLQFSAEVWLAITCMWNQWDATVWVLSSSVSPPAPADHHADWHERALVGQAWLWHLRAPGPPPGRPRDRHHRLRRLLPLAGDPAAGRWFQGGGGQPRPEPGSQWSVSRGGGAAVTEGGGGQRGQGGVRRALPRALRHPGGAEGAAGREGAGGC